MATRSLLAFFRIAVTILFYFLAVVTLFFLVNAAFNLSGKHIDTVKLTTKAYSFEVIDFDTKASEQAYRYSSDSLMRYRPVKDHFTVQIEPNSPIGYYSTITTLIFLILGMGVLWTFMKIFKETKLDAPFLYSISGRLKILAALFIVSEVLEIINYFVLNRFLRTFVPGHHFELFTTVGDGLITGLIIWIIALVYQRGIVIQEENALTV
jgi:hypothetical protein